MASDIKGTEQDPRGKRITGWRIAGWGIAGLLMLVPLAAMQFTDEVQWSASDFLFAGVMLGSVGLGFELVASRSGSGWFRAGAAVALVAALLTVWINAAVGMIGSEQDDYNLWFGAVLLVALGGAVVARFRAFGMRNAMIAAAVVQAGLSVAGMAIDPRGGMLSMVFVVPWVIAAGLFAVAGRRDERR